MSEPGEVTRLLAELNQGGRDVLDRLVPLVYDELQRIASRRLQAERADHTLATTDLVHEAYAKLVGLERIEWKSRAQFFALCAQAMRRILVDHALRRKAQKRGGDRRRLGLDEVSIPVGQPAEEMLALHEAMERLAAVDARQSRVVECRYFAGMTVEETAEALGVSAATVKRDWTLARAWLHRELGT